MHFQYNNECPHCEVARRNKFRSILNYFDFYRLHQPHINFKINNINNSANVYIERSIVVIIFFM